MKAGYTGELTNHQDKLTGIKGKLEEFYAARHDDKNITGELKTNMDSMMSEADAIILGFNTGTRIIKSALVLCKNLRGQIYLEHLNVKQVHVLCLRY